LGGGDVSRALAERHGRSEGRGRRYLLPDVCLSEGRFLDGLTTAQLPLPVEVVETTGAALRCRLEATRR